METKSFTVVADGIRLAVHLQPGAKREAFAGSYGDKLKIAVTAPPVEGRANRAVVKFLAAFFGVAARDVELLIGETSRDKIFLIRGKTADLVNKVEKVLS